MASVAWKRLEKDVLRLVSKELQATHSDGGPRCIVAGYQVDAYGVFEKTALVFECKTGKRVSLNQAIDRFSGGRAAIRRELVKQYGRKIKHFRFIVLVGTAEEIAIYNRRRRKPRDIVVWTPKYFSAVVTLAKAIRRRALPYILRELRVKNLRDAMALPKGTLRLPALRVLNGRGKRSGATYSFFAPARTLLDLGYVARLESNLPSAYQRLLKGSRLKDIRDYINAGNSFKNSVVVNLPETTRFQKKSSVTVTGESTKIEVGLLRIPLEPASLWIIDGQHRIYGYGSTQKLDSPLSVVGVQFVNIFEQGKIFVDINKNQKPVDPNLLWDLYFHLTPTEPTGVISSLVRDLGRNRHSILYEKIYLPELSQKARKDYRIYMANVCEAIVKQGLLQAALGYSSRTKLEDLTSARIIKASGFVYRRLNLLYSSLHEMCTALGYPSWWRNFFLSNNGISIVIRLLKEICIYKKVPLTKQGLKSLLRRPLQTYFSLMDGRIDEVLRNTSSEGGRESVAVDILSQVNRVHPEFAVEKLKEAQRITRGELLYKIVGFFEKSMRGIIKKELSQFTPKWWEERIPPQVREKADAIWEQKGNKGERLDYVDISDYPRIISHNWADCFSKPYAGAKKDKNWLNQKFQELMELRNKYFHFHGSVSPSEEDTWHARIVVHAILQPFGIDMDSIEAAA